MKIMIIKRIKEENQKLKIKKMRKKKMKIGKKWKKKIQN